MRGCRPPFKFTSSLRVPAVAAPTRRTFILARAESCRVRKRGFLKDVDVKSLWKRANFAGEVSRARILQSLQKTLRVEQAELRTKYAYLGKKGVRI